MPSSSNSFSSSSESLPSSEAAGVELGLGGSDNGRGYLNRDVPSVFSNVRSG